MVNTISPQNMGKGLIRNEETGQYDVNVNSDQFELNDKLNQIQLKLSALSDNQLQHRDDGLYIGSTAPFEWSHQYVSSSTGNDSNDGTRNNPLRTIDEAFKRIKNISVTCYIYLHEGDVFEFESAEYYSADKNKIIFEPYGNARDTKYPFSVPLNYYFRGYVANDYPRPEINFRVKLSKQYSNVVRRDSITANCLEFYGIKFNIYSKFEGVDSPEYSGSFSGIINTRILGTLIGCVFEEKTKPVIVYTENNATYRSDVLLRGDWNYIDCFINSSVFVISPNFTSKFTVISWNSGLQKFGEYSYTGLWANKSTAQEDMYNQLKNLYMPLSKNPYGNILTM